MTFFFSVACSSIIRLAPSRSWGKSFLDTVSCISSSRASIWVAWPEKSSNATRTWTETPANKKKKTLSYGDPLMGSLVDCLKKETIRSERRIILCPLVS